MFADAIRNNFKDIEITVEPIELEEDVIVDNPDEVVVQIPIVSNIQTEEKLPFFKSVMMKLASI